MTFSTTDAQSKKKLASGAPLSEDERRRQIDVMPEKHKLVLRWLLRRVERELGFPIPKP